MTDQKQVVFKVAGVPAPQGSKTRTKFGMREDNKATRPWREAVAWNATEAKEELLAGPLELVAWFYFPRPKSHYRTGKLVGKLKENAPLYCTTKPDVDKLIRACADAMTGIVYQDDSQIVKVQAFKIYGDPHADIIVRPLHA